MSQQYDYKTSCHRRHDSCVVRHDSSCVIREMTQQYDYKTIKLPYYNCHIKPNLHYHHNHATTKLHYYQTALLPQLNYHHNQIPTKGNYYNNQPHHYQTTCLPNNIISTTEHFSHVLHATKQHTYLASET